MNQEILTQRNLETYTKQLPQLGSILGKIEEMYSAPGLGQVICDSSHEFDRAYLGWQTVRLLRSPAIIGSNFLASGFEGYYVGVESNAKEIIVSEARLGQEVLDHDINTHRYQMNRRHALDALMHGTIDPKVLRSAYGMFGELKTRVSLLPARVLGENKDKNKKFRDETKMFVSDVPPMNFLHCGKNFSHSYALPLTAKTANHIGLGEGDIPNRYKDGFTLIRTIGLVGHPVFRRIQSTHPLIARISSERAYYPPKGSTKRMQMDFHELVSILAELYPHAPQSVEKFIENLPN